jgi:hypothetical protein
MEPIYSPTGELIEATFRVWVYRGLSLVHHEKVRLSLVQWDRVPLQSKFDKYLRRLECRFVLKRDPCPERHPITSKYDMVEKSRPCVVEKRSCLVAISWIGKPEVDGRFFQDVSS